MKPLPETGLPWTSWDLPPVSSENRKRYFRQLLYKNPQNKASANNYRWNVNSIIPTKNYYSNFGVMVTALFVVNRCLIMNFITKSLNWVLLVIFSSEEVFWDNINHSWFFESFKTRHPMISSVMIFFAPKSAHFWFFYCFIPHLNNRDCSF